MEEGKLRKVSFIVSFIGIILLFVFCLIFDETPKEIQRNNVLSGYINTKKEYREEYYGIVRSISKNKENNTLILKISHIDNKTILFYDAKNKSGLSNIKVSDYVYIKAIKTSTKKTDGYDGVLFGEELYTIK